MAISPSTAGPVVQSATYRYREQTDSAMLTTTVAASLPELDSFDRNSLTDASGQSYKEFRKLLKPRFARAWFDIGLGFGAIALTIAAIVWIDQQYPAWFLLTGAVGACLLGYFIAYVQLFFHEAAHYNLAKDRAVNDRLANAFLGVMVGQDIRAYRIVHFDHHRHLGTTADTERSYFNALTPTFLFQAVTGIQVVKVLLLRRKVAGQKREASATAAGSQNAGSRPPPNRSRAVTIAGLVLNASIVLFSAWSGNWALFLAWPIGMLFVHPTINAVRQILEHRSFTASAANDYSTVPHGAIGRMFGAGPLASSLGGAGFNRHLLHHWEPQISYTRFPELESFLLESQAADTVRSVTTTYATVFLRLIKAP